MLRVPPPSPLRLSHLFVIQIVTYIFSILFRLQIYIIPSYSKITIFSDFSLIFLTPFYHSISIRCSYFLPPPTLTLHPRHHFSSFFLSPITSVFPLFLSRTSYGVDTDLSRRYPYNSLIFNQIAITLTSNHLTLNSLPLTHFIPSIKSHFTTSQPIFFLVGLFSFQFPQIL